MEEKSFTFSGALVVVKRVQQSDVPINYYGYCPRPGEYGWTSDLLSAKFFTGNISAEEDAKNFKNTLCNHTKVYSGVEVAKLVLMNL